MIWNFFRVYLLCISGLKHTIKFFLPIADQQPQSKRTSWIGSTENTEEKFETAEWKPTDKRPEAQAFPKQIPIVEVQ